MRFTSALHRMNRRAGAALLAALVLGFIAATPAVAAGTLDRIRQSGRMTMGYVPDAPPFSSADATGKPAGYAIALCNKVAAAVQSELKLSSLAVDFVPVADDRFKAVEQGRVDLLCGAVPTLERRALVDFSIPILMSGSAAMVRADTPARLTEVLAGRQPPEQPTWRASLDQAPQRRAIAVIGDTPLEKALADRLATLHIVVQLVPVKDVASGVQMLLDRSADAFLADRALLLDAAHRSRSPADLVVLQRIFKREPVALAMHRGEDDLRLIVDRTLSRLYSTQEFRSMYAASFGAPDAAALDFFQLVALPD